jgi:hypothetical protein
MALEIRSGACGRRRRWWKQKEEEKRNREMERDRERVGETERDKEMDRDRDKSQEAHHITDRPDEGVVSIKRISAVNRFRDSEISNFNNAATVEKNISWFDIAMHVTT